MKKFLIAALVMGTVTAAQAEIRTGRPRAILVAHMQGSEGRIHFKGVNEATLTLTKTGGTQGNFPTGMFLRFTPAQGADRNVYLLIQQSEVDQCGSTHYYGNLAQSNSGVATGARFSVHLTDHSTRTCEDLKKFRWEADVREGYGWCGTMDSTLHLVGNPESAIVTQ